MALPKKELRHCKRYRSNGDEGYIYVHTVMYVYICLYMIIYIMYFLKLFFVVF